MLTDHGSESCSNPEGHEYELYLAVEDIDQFLRDCSPCNEKRTGPEALLPVGLSGQASWSRDNAGRTEALVDR
jgi:hypothetical protein